MSYMMDRIAEKLVRQVTLSLYKQVLGPWRFLQGFWWRTKLGLPPAPQVKLLRHSATREHLLARLGLDSKRANADWTRNAAFTQAIIDKFRTDFGRPYSDMAKEYEASVIHGRAMRGVAGSELQGAQLRRAYAMVNQGRGQTMLAWLAISDWFRSIAMYRDIPEFLKRRSVKWRTPGYEYFALIPYTPNGAIRRLYRGPVARVCNPLTFTYDEGVLPPGPEQMEQARQRIEEKLKEAGIEMPRLDVEKWKLDPAHQRLVNYITGDPDAFGGESITTLAQERMKSFPEGVIRYEPTVQFRDYSQIERRFLKESE